MNASITSNPQDVLIGIVTLNRKDKLAKTLGECRRLGFENILVLDNGSTDGTREYLQQQEGIATILTEKNEGGSGGFNRIMRFFVEQMGCRWLLIFDDDAYPAFDYKSLATYLDCEKSFHRPAYAFRVTYPDGSLCEMNRPGVNLLIKNPLYALGRNFHIDASSKGCLVDFAGFVGLLLSRETVETVGVVSKEFFIYSDDTYYTLSISSKVGKIFYCPDLVLIHDCNRSSRRLRHHNPTRLEKEVVNKIVMIREYSRFRTAYVGFYLARLIMMNPSQSLGILRAGCKGLTANLALYRNQPIELRQTTQGDTVGRTSSLPTHEVVLR